MIITVESFRSGVAYAQCTPYEYSYEYSVLWSDISILSCVSPIQDSIQ